MLNWLDAVSTPSLLAVRADLAKYREDQARDAYGRWTDDGDEPDEVPSVVQRFGTEEQRRAWATSVARIRRQGVGNCYAAAVTLALKAEALGLRDAKVIQATALGTTGAIKNTPFGHSWLEARGIGPYRSMRMAYDFSSGNSAIMPVDQYRMLGRIRDVHEFTPDEARVEMLRAGHYGPWYTPAADVAFREAA